MTTLGGKPMHRMSINPAADMDKRKLSIMPTSSSEAMTRRRARTGSRYTTSVGDRTSRNHQLNTYRMTPMDVFKPREVETVINDILELHLNDKKYDVMKTSQLSISLSNLIQDSIKSLGLHRYKLICHIVLGELKSQGLTTSSRALWDDTQDNYACCHYQNEEIFAIASVHAVYYE